MNHMKTLTDKFIYLNQFWTISIYIYFIVYMQINRKKKNLSNNEDVDDFPKGKYFVKTTNKTNKKRGAWANENKTKEKKAEEGLQFRGD